MAYEFLKNLGHAKTHSWGYLDQRHPTKSAKAVKEKTYIHKSYLYVLKHSRSLALAEFTLMWWFDVK